MTQLAGVGEASGIDRDSVLRVGLCPTAAPPLPPRCLRQFNLPAHCLLIPKWLWWHPFPEGPMTLLPLLPKPPVLWTPLSTCTRGPRIGSHLRRTAWTYRGFPDASGGHGSNKEHPNGCQVQGSSSSATPRKSDGEMDAGPFLLATHRKERRPTFKRTQRPRIGPGKLAIHLTRAPCRKGYSASHNCASQGCFNPVYRLH